MDERDLLSGERVTTSCLWAGRAYAYCMKETKWAKQNEQKVRGGKNTEKQGEEMILPTNKFETWSVSENTHLFTTLYSGSWLGELLVEWQAETLLSDACIADRALSKNFSS